MKQLFFFFLFIFSFNQGFTQESYSVFSQSPAGTAESGYCLFKLNNSYYISSNLNVGTGGNSTSLMQIRPDKTVRRHLTFAGSKSGVCAQTSSGGFVFTGPGYTSAVQPKLFLFKTDSLGSINWFVDFNLGLTYLEGTDLIQTSDGGYCLTSTIGYPDPNFIIKTNANGVVEWSKSLPRLLLGSAAILETSDHGIVVAGTAKNHPGVSGQGVYIFKLDLSGNLLWSEILDTRMNDYYENVVDLKEDSSSNLVLMGNIGWLVNSHSSGDLMLMKLSPDGNFIWEKELACSDTMRQIFNGSLLLKNNNEILMLATECDRYNFAFVNDQAILVSTDSSGNIQWSKQYGDSANQITHKHSLISDSTGFAFTFNQLNPLTNVEGVGLITTDNMGNVHCHSSNYDMIDSTRTPSIIIPTDTLSETGYQFNFSGTSVSSESLSAFDLCLLTSIQETTGKQEKIFSIYPNPASSRMTIESTIDGLEKSDLVIRNASGQIVLKQMLEKFPAEIVLENFENGVYSAQVQTTMHMSQQLFVVTH